MSELADLLLPRGAKQKTIPIHVARKGNLAEDLPNLSKEQRAWLEATGFCCAAGSHALFPGSDGKIAGVILGLGAPATTREARIGRGKNGSMPSEHYFGKLPAKLPAGRYHLELDSKASAAAGIDPALATLAWGLGGYRFDRYKSRAPRETTVLKLPNNIDREALSAQLEAVWLGRDLINTPSNDMGPDELESAAKKLAKQHSANVTVIKGDNLIAKNFPLIHAVGRASTRAPRLIDLTWGKASAPKVTLVGKGVCFDTGGLDIKPASGMLLMKKDMGGAAAVLALGSMIMAAKLPVRLRILIPALENAISGDAFRPGDIIASRSGQSVEVGNTDAEGRLVLADALALADEMEPDYLMTFATLTGAARVALGPDLPPFYCDDDELAGLLSAKGQATMDPLWQMPFWSPYDAMLDSPNADMNNVNFNGFAGSITAALFLRRFVRDAARYTHFDIFGWRPAAAPLAPKGGDPQAVRAVFAAFQDIFAA